MEVKKNHQISLGLEHAARRALNLQDRGGLFGVIDAGYIEREGNAFIVIVAALSPYYKDGGDETKAAIDKFLERYSYLDDEDCPEEKYVDGLEEVTKELHKLMDSLE